MRKILVLPAVLLCLAFNAPAAVLPAEKLLPDDTLIMFTVPDFNQARTIYHDSPQGRFWNDPAMKDFKDKFINKLTSTYITPLEQELGIHLDDYTALPQGQITFAFVQNGWDGKPGHDPALLVLMDTKDKSAQLTKALTDLKKKWVDAGKTVKTEKIRDIDFSVITPSRADIPKLFRKSDPASPDGSASPDSADSKKTTKEPLYVGQAESLLIVSDSPAAIEKILVRMSGGQLKSLSEVAAYDASAPMFRDSQAFGWVNVKTFMDVLNHPDAENGNPNQTFNWKKIIAAIGLGNLRTVAFDYLYKPEGAQFNFSLAVPESDRVGLFKIMAGEPKDCNPPPFVPADAVKFQRWRIDGQKAWATIRKMVGDVYPAGVGTIDFVIGTAEAAAKEKDPNFDLNKYLFANLGDDMITYQKNPKSDAPADFAAPPSIFLLGSPNPDQLASALKSLLVLYGQQASTPATEREFLGHKINSIQLPPQPNADGSSTPRSMSYVSAGGYLAISADNALIEEYLRSGENPPKALRDVAGLNDAGQKITAPGTSLFGYANDRESMRAFFNRLKKDPEAANALARLSPLASAPGMSDVKATDWVDASLLPDFDKVSKYFYFSVYSGGANADALTFKAFAPAPPELNK